MALNSPEMRWRKSVTSWCGGQVVFKNYWINVRWINVLSLLACIYSHWVVINPPLKQFYELATIINFSGFPELKKRGNVEIEFALFRLIAAIVFAFSKSVDSARYTSMQYRWSARSIFQQQRPSFYMGAAITQKSRDYLPWTRDMNTSSSQKTQFSDI